MKRCLRFFFVLISSSLTIATTSSSSDSFDESLLIRSLEDGKLHTRFTFELMTNLPTTVLQSARSPNVQLFQSHLVPLSLSEILEKFGVGQMSLSLSRGRWEHERWYHPVDEQWQGYPRGGQLSAWLYPTENLSALTNSLSGIFCTSLNRLSLIDSLPSDILIPSEEESIREGGLKLYHGLLPLEQPCTENLSPLLRLLPCDGQAGLASLVDGHHLFEGNWQSLRFHLFRNFKRPGMKVKIEIETVLDPVRKTTRREWSLSTIFGKEIRSDCPLSNSSQIKIIDSPDSQIEPRAHQDGMPIEGKHTFDLKRAVLPLDIEMKWPKEERFAYPQLYTPGPIGVKRILTGYGQTRGSLGVEITINEPDIEQALIYHEELPWWLSIYLHTLKIFVNDIQINPRELIASQVLKPSVQRERPYSLSMKLKPKKGTKKIQIEYEYEKDLLLYTEYPSDANRGFDLPSALVIYEKISFWTSGGLIGLATPDFSMPYNVIIVTSTALALFFGSVFNLMVREFKLLQLGKKDK